MPRKATAKTLQTQALFEKIRLPLKQSLDIDFGYSVFYDDGSFYSILPDLNATPKITQVLDQGYLICDQNVSSDLSEFSYLLWPEEVNDPAIEILYNSGFNNAISLMRQNPKNVEVFSFSGGPSRGDWKEFFLRNKEILHQFIIYFEKFKKELFIDEANIRDSLFKFKKGIVLSVPESVLSEEQARILDLRKQILVNNINSKITQPNMMLAPRESQILQYIARGYTAKAISLELGISPKTVQNYIERMKNKLNINTKHQLIKFFESSQK